MKFRLMTPGPTPVPEETLLELAKPVPYHRTNEFRQLFTEILEDMKYVYQTSGSVLALTASGSGGSGRGGITMTSPSSSAASLP